MKTPPTLLEGIFKGFAWGSFIGSIPLIIVALVMHKPFFIGLAAAIFVLAILCIREFDY